MELQHTIAGPASVSGRGLFSGKPATVTFRPAPENHGVVFVRKDLGGARIPALVQHVVKQPRRTTLQVGTASVETCEHCLSAVAALQIDNLIIEIDNLELPALDGSAKPYLEALQQAGVKQAMAQRQRLVITEPVVAKLNDAVVAAVPNETPSLQVVYNLDYGLEGPLGRQVMTFDFQNGNYAEQVAPARTFITEKEAQALRDAGIGTHLSPAEVLVIGHDGPLGGNRFRFPDEPVRHKVVDLIGDLYLLGSPIQGRVIAYKSGHALNHLLVRQLLRMGQAHSRRSITRRPEGLDIRKLTRILPHRYPMLLVDRVLEIDGDKRAVGVKNVTINEPFFQGHYPGVPIMPGVLVVEAMAQLSGVLINQNLEHTGRVAVLMSLDRVKLRRPVTPGDQLILEAEAVRVRGRIAHMRCRAYVDGDTVAEAEVKFMLMDDEQE